MVYLKTTEYAIKYASDNSLYTVFLFHRRNIFLIPYKVKLEYGENL